MCVCWFVCLFVACTTVHVQHTHSGVVRIHKWRMCVCWFVCSNATSAYTPCACASRRVRHCVCAKSRKEMRNKVATETLRMYQTPQENCVTKSRSRRRHCLRAKPQEKLPLFTHSAICQNHVLTGGYVPVPFLESCSPATIIITIKVYEIVRK